MPAGVTSVLGVQDFCFVLFSSVSAGVRTGFWTQLATGIGAALLNYGSLDFLLAFPL